MSLVVGMDNLFFSSRSLTVVDPAFTVTVDWEEGGVVLPTFQGRREAFCSSVVSHRNCCII